MCPLPLEAHSNLSHEMEVQLNYLNYALTMFNEEIQISHKDTSAPTIISVLLALFVPDLVSVSLRVHGSAKIVNRKN